METVYSGRVWKFGDKISTDLMVPGSYVLARRNMDQAEAAMQCMRANRPDWARQVRPGDILIAGRNFGCGSSRNGSEPLKTLGIAVVLVESVSRIHLRNAINTGLPTLVCPGIVGLADEGQRISIDILSGKVVNTRYRSRVARRQLAARQPALPDHDGGRLHSVLQGKAAHRRPDHHCKRMKEPR